MQVARRREMKMMVVEVGLWGELAVEDGEESVLKVSRAADGFAASSSWEGSGVGFVGVKIDKESEPIVGKGASFFEIVLNQCVMPLGEMKSWSKTKGVWLGWVGLGRRRERVWWRRAFVLACSSQQTTTCDC